MQTSGVSGAHDVKHCVGLIKLCCCCCQVILEQTQERTEGEVRATPPPQEGERGRSSGQRPRQGCASDHKDSWSLLPAVTHEPLQRS